MVKKEPAKAGRLGWCSCIALERTGEWTPDQAAHRNRHNRPREAWKSTALRERHLRALKALRIQLGLEGLCEFEDHPSTLVTLVVEAQPAPKGGSRRSGEQAEDDFLDRGLKLDARSKSGVEGVGRREERCAIN